MLLLAASAAIAQVVPPEGRYLKDLRQLTHGGQNAEAYWAPDGKRLIFQSTRDPYRCDQIFIMNANGSDQRLVSTGKGRTTCAYFLKDNKHFVYGSTHERAPECPPSPDRSKGYVWPVYAGYDIFLATDDGKIKKHLTQQNGYDAEATVNWATGTIIYTSKSSNDLDLWTMKPDGSRKTRVTTTEGYDGGAVFSRDGRQIVWRANHPSNEEAMKTYRALLDQDLTSPMKMELFVSDRDGRNVKQLTSFGCAAFAPTFTPDGKRIVFASNKHNCDGRKFELYMVDADGSNLVQVTNFGGFTSFPEFSPDGKKLVFSSDYQAKARYEFNIFVAGWVE